VAWCAEHFADAPPIVNLLDPAIRTRGQLLRRFREHGWRGSMLWVPISLLAAAVSTMRFVVGLGRRERARPLAVWSILRPRRYDAAVATAVLAAAGDHTSPAEPSLRAAPAAPVTQAYG
jgi:hypothetical protein